MIGTHNSSALGVKKVSISYTSHPRQAAFTLVELLVVIAIIALLASLLSPALSRGRERAKLITCKSQVRQMLAALPLYAADHGGGLPRGNPRGGWFPGHWMSGFFSEFDNNSYLPGATRKKIYDGLPPRHILRGLAVLWGLDYLENKDVLMDPTWVNDQDNDCVSYNGIVDYSKWYPPPYAANRDKELLYAGGWSTGSYVFFTYVGRENFPGQDEIGGSYGGSPRIYGQPVMYRGEVANTAMIMCRMGRPSWTGVGCHKKERMNVGFEDGSVTTLENIQEKLADMLSRGKDRGNEAYYINNVQDSWWRWASVESGRL